MRFAAALLLPLLLLTACRSANDASPRNGAADDMTATSPDEPRTPQRAGIVPTGDVPGQGTLPDGKTHVFDCTTAAGDSLGFTVRVDSATAWLWMPHEMQVEPVRLQQVEAASGARYAGDDTEFRREGEEAAFVIEGARYENCTRNNYRSVWEDARLDGVDFRALGNEPGWIVDVYAGDRFDVQWRYGERTAVLPYTQPETPDDSTTVFRSETDEHALTMTITGGGCTDSMSGIAFPVAVTIRIDGSEYTGCGRPLH